MNAFFPATVQGLWIAYCKNQWKRFEAAASNVETSQKEILQGYLTRNTLTMYGKRYRFDKISSIAEFQEALPVTTYDDYADEIGAIAEGRQRVLTSDKVRLFEPSSGSAGPTKLIPYTSTLKAEFHRGISAWLFNLYTRHPDCKGIAYWSISPAGTCVQRLTSVVPVGFETDSDYLSPLGRYITTLFQAVPSEVALISDIDSFRYVTLLFLLSCRNLRLISVWNPAFLTLLFDFLGEYWESLTADLSSGEISPPKPIDRQLFSRLIEKFGPLPRRAKEVSGCNAIDIQSIWPNLCLISCWQDGPSKRYASFLQQKYCPAIAFQGKGLIATEAFVSFPLFGTDDTVLAGTSHFFEFLPLTDTGELAGSLPLLAHQLESGRFYSVIVTTGGGLYRYQLQDMIKVIGHYKEMPLIRFIGKLDGISDIFGEKLHGQFVYDVLSRAFARFSLQPKFFIVAPSTDFTHYILFLEDPLITDRNCALLAADIERRLLRNFHYAYCRKLGQLGAVRISLLNSGALREYFSHCRAKGLGLGNIKSSVLSNTPITFTRSQ